MDCTRFAAASASSCERAYARPTLTPRLASSSATTAPIRLAPVISATVCSSCMQGQLREARRKNSSEHRRWYSLHNQPSPGDIGGPDVRDTPGRFSKKYSGSRRAGMDETVGFIGLGVMGRPMAKHILAKGYRVVVH